MPKIIRLTPITSPTPPRGKRSAIGAPTSTKTVQATEIANFLWSSTAFMLISRWLSRIRSRALSTDPRSETGIWGDTDPSRGGGRAAAMTLSRRARWESAGTTTAGVCGVGCCAEGEGGGGVPWLPTAAAAAYKLGTSIAIAFAATRLARRAASQYARPSDALGDRGAGAPGVMLNIVIEEISGGLAGTPVSASLATARIASRRSVFALLYSAS